MESKIVIGQKAPNFTLLSADLKPRRLEDFLNKNVVLAFYPGAFTAVCTKEMCIFRDSLGKLRDLKAQVVGISVNDPFSNKAFAEVNSLDFPLLSDYNREVVRLYGVAARDFAGLKGYTAAKRSIFVVDKKRIVRYAWVSEDPRVEPDYEEIERVLEEIG
jgi:peroxiredoxin